MPEVSAGSNQVGANVTLLPHVTCPCGPAAPVEPVQRRTLEPVSRAENFRSSRRLRSPADQVAILIPLGSLKRDDFSSNRHRALTSCWSMIFPETGTHFSGSCSSSNAAPIRARKEICVPETGVHTSYTTCAPSAILGTGPVERDVLARIGRPLEFEPERIDRTDGRFAPGHDLSRPGLGARRVDELRILPGQTGRAGQGVGPGFHLAGDLGAPICAVGRDLKSDPRALHAANLPAFGEQPGDKGGKAADLTAEDTGKHLGLTFVGALVDEDAGAALGPSGPQIAFPSSHPHEAQAVEIDVAVMAPADMPEQDRLAEIIVRGLGERAGARNRAAAIIEPVADDAPAGNRGHVAPPDRATWQSL